MNDTIVLTCVIALAAVAFASLLVVAMVFARFSDGSQKHDRVMAVLLTKAVNAAVVAEVDQVARVEAESGVTPSAVPGGIHSAAPMAPGEKWETTGESRGDPID